MLKDHMSKSLLAKLYNNRIKCMVLLAEFQLCYLRTIKNFEKPIGTI